MPIPADVAQQICRELLRQWAAELPDRVQVTIGGSGRFCFIGAVPRYSDAEKQEMVERGRREGSVTHPMSASARTFGLGLPVGSRVTRQRRMLADIAVELRDSIAQASTSTWPSETAAIRTAHDGDEIRLWFEDAAGVQLLPATIDVTTLT